MSASGKGGLYFVSGLTKEGRKGDMIEWIGIESGEGDDERKGHSFGEVNVNSKQCSGAPSPQTRRSPLPFSGCGCFRDWFGFGDEAEVEHMARTWGRWTFACDPCQKNVTDLALCCVTYLDSSDSQSMARKRPKGDIQVSLPHLVPSQHQVHPTPSNTSQERGPPTPSFDAASRCPRGLYRSVR